MTNKTLITTAGFQQLKQDSKGTWEGIYNHVKATEYYSLSAKHHIEAVKQQEIGNYKKAYKSTVQAQGIAILAMTFKEEM